MKKAINLKKAFWISFALALVYFSFSLFYFFGLHADFIANVFGERVEEFFLLPGIYIYGVAFAVGRMEAVWTGSVIFLFTWAGALILTVLRLQLINSLSKKT